MFEDLHLDPLSLSNNMFRKWVEICLNLIIKFIPSMVGILSYQTRQGYQHFLSEDQKTIPLNLLSLVSSKYLPILS